MKQLNLALYRKAYLIRAAEGAIRKHYGADKMKTPMHMSTGEEGIVAGVCEALRPADQVLGTYRSHGLYLAKSGETDRFFAEMYGKASGMAKGKGGSMHLTNVDAGLICTSAIVGTTIPVALGAAYANRMRGSDSVVAVFFGDGAVDEGVFWESLNAACAMNLRIVFVCEDNGFAVHVPKAQRHGYRSLPDVARQFDCKVYAESSTDAEVIYKLTRHAIAELDDGRPAFMHLQYYRYLEHVGVNEDFDQGYRSKDEYERWLRDDPVDLLRRRLLQYCEEAELRSLEKSIDDQIEQSVRRADDAPFPSSDELLRDVYA